MNALQDIESYGYIISDGTDAIESNQNSIRYGGAGAGGSIFILCKQMIG